MKLSIVLLTTLFFMQSFSAVANPNVLGAATDCQMIYAVNSSALTNIGFVSLGHPIGLVEITSSIMLESLAEELSKQSGLSKESAYRIAKDGLQALHDSFFTLLKVWHFNQEGTAELVLHNKRDDEVLFNWRTGPGVMHYMGDVSGVIRSELAIARNQDWAPLPYEMKVKMSKMIGLALLANREPWAGFVVTSVADNETRKAILKWSM